MQIALALLADYANISREGKLNILGIFEQIAAHSLPASHPQMQLVMTLEADGAEADRDHKIEIQLIDADGKKLFTFGGNLKFSPPPPGQKARLNHIIQINNTKFNDFGNYDFKILVNDEVRTSIPLALVEVKKS